MNISWNVFFSGNKSCDFKKNPQRLNYARKLNIGRAAMCCSYSVVSLSDFIDIIIMHRKLSFIHYWMHFQMLIITTLHILIAVVHGYVWLWPISHTVLVFTLWSGKYFCSFSVFIILNFLFSIQYFIIIRITLIYYIGVL